MKLLIVDDDAFLRDMYATKFTEAGHTVVTAKDGNDALREFEHSGPFDLMLLDMVMPGLTGVELLKEVKKLDTEKKTKCVVLSNQGESTDIDAATNAGAVGYIIKAESIPSEVVTKVEKLAQ